MTTAITGRLATCPNCDRAAGIPLPCGSTITQGADEADGSEHTLCPDCETRFRVYYAREPSE